MLTARFPIGKRIIFQRKYEGSKMQAGRVAGVDEAHNIVYAVINNGAQQIEIRPDEDIVRGEFDYYMPHKDYDTPETRQLCDEMNIFITLYMVFREYNIDHADHELHDIIHDFFHGAMTFENVRTVNYAMLSTILSTGRFDEVLIVREVPEASELLDEMHENGMLPLKKKGASV